MKAHIIEKECKLCHKKTTQYKTLHIKDVDAFMEMTGAAMPPKDLEPIACQDCVKKMCNAYGDDHKRIMARLFFE